MVLLIFFQPFLSFLFFEEGDALSGLLFFLLGLYEGLHEFGLLVVERVFVNSDFLIQRGQPSCEIRRTSLIFSQLDCILHVLIKTLYVLASFLFKLLQNLLVIFIIVLSPIAFSLPSTISGLGLLIKTEQLELLVFLFLSLLLFFKFCFVVDDRLFLFSEVF